MNIRLLWRERVLIGLLISSGVVLALLSDVFLTPANLLRATRYAAEIGLVALPMTMIIISRGIDLSVASNMALSAMAMGLLWQRGLPIWPAVAIGVVTGTLAGWLNGWVIARVRVPAIVVTLATLAVYRGTAKSNAAAGYELSIITAVVLGGTSLAGGEGTLVGTVLGVLILTILQNGLTLARVPAAMQDVLIGTVLLAAVLTYRERPMRKEVSAQSTSQPAPRRAAGRAMSDPENTLAAGEERRKP